MADEQGDLELEQTDDGQWAVVRDGDQLSIHPHEAGAEAERTRISQAEQDGGGIAPDDSDPEEGPYPDNVGS